MLGAAETAHLVRLIRGAGRLPAIGRLDPDEVWRSLLRDKKFEGGKLRMVFLRALGEGAVLDGVEASSLRRFLERFLAGNGNLE